MNSMKKSNLTALLLLFFLRIHAQEDTGIRFVKEGFDAAVQKAKAEKKPVFLHAYASWCHYCQFMADSVYTDREVSEFYNSNYISVKMDMEQEGREMNKKLRVKTYPTIVFFDYNGTGMMHRESGKKSKAEFLQLGRDALDSTKQLRTFERRYYNKTATVAEITTYFKMLDKAGLDNQAPINAYLEGLSDQKMLEYENWRIMYDLFKEVELPAFGRVMALRKGYEEKYTADSIDNKVISLYMTALMSRVQKLDTGGYNNMITKLKKSGMDLSEKIIDYAELNKAKMKSDWKTYQQLAVPFIEKHCMQDYRRLNEVAYNFYERVNDTLLLSKAIVWSETAVATQDNVRNNHTLASLYYKAGRKKEARAACLHTMEIAKRIKVDYRQSTLLLEKIEELKDEEPIKK